MVEADAARQRHGTAEEERPPVRILGREVGQGGNKHGGGERDQHAGDDVEHRAQSRR
jgi:hypothetical protein